MKILAVHNRYQRPGGEDQVFVDETALLEARDHRVLRYEVHNDQVERVNRLTLAKDTVWNTPVYRELGALIRRERPDVVHFHNTLPLVSPAGYYAARAEGVPVIQTLHNYRLLCPVALFFRDGRVCEDCMGKAVPWPGVVHKCYRGSRAASGVIAAMLTVHRVLRTWTEMVDVYIALTEFARSKFIEGGLPAGKIVVKPNFVAPDPGRGQGGGGYALFVGRLAPEKGTGTMLAAWERLGTRIPLKIVGDGPLRDRVVGAAKRSKVEWLGHRPVKEVHALMGKADMLVFPSEWYETFGRVAAEAFATGTPVIAADIGAVAELVEHGRTGLIFRPGDPEDLVAQVEWALSHPAELRIMRDEARAEFEAKYTAERNYRALMEIYEAALGRKKVPA
ncbi:MAG: glycosyltransferase family 4 protein [Actinomycetota bacterium]|nr:glycosyltransferase family 4 protein [Actinomycetota bacterium]